MPVDAGGGNPRPVDRVYANALNKLGFAAGCAARARNVLLHRRAGGSAIVIQRCNPAMRQHADGVPEIVGPVIEGRPDVIMGKCRADIVCQRPLGFQIGVSERVDRLVRFRFRDVIKPRSPVFVQFVHRRHPKRRLHRTAENQPIRRLYAQCELRIEAAYDFVKFIVRCNLRVETRPHRNRNLDKEPVDLACIVVGIIPGCERIGANLVLTTDVSRNQAGIRVLIGRVVGHGGHGGPAKLIPDRICRKIFDQTAGQYGIGHK